MRLTHREKKLLAELVYTQHIRLMTGVVDVDLKLRLLALWNKLGGK